MDLAKYNKAWVAAASAALFFVNSKYGVSIPLDEMTLSTIWMAITAILVHQVPNKQ